jgi:microcystin degradation protein MlrC
MRIAIAGYQHESNSFAKIPASLDKWTEAGILLGAEINKEYENSKATVAGLLARLKEESDVDIHPLVFARLTPMGPLTREATDHLMNLILTAVKEGGPWDAVFLPQHGAAVSEKYLDADGELVEKVRELVGPNVIIGTALDMHANVSQKVVANSNIVTIYQTNPHIDTFEQAYHCADLVIRCLRNQIQPTSFLATPPLLVNILKQGTSDKPMSDLLQMAERERQRPGVLSVSIIEGFPYADVPQMGMAFLTITQNDPELAEEVAVKISKYAWEVRDQLQGYGTPIEEGLLEADAAAQGPIVLFDVGDNVPGGTPGDSTFVLHAAHKLGITGLLQALCDPQAVAICLALGVGARVDLAVGGKADGMHGSPLPIKGKITAITDGKYSEPKASHGGFLYYDDGPSAAIDTDDGNHILLTSLPTGSGSLQQFRSAGFEPLKEKIIVVKGTHSPRPAYEPIAKKMIWLATAGASTADLSYFTYRHRRVPMYPLEPETTWS